MIDWKKVTGIAVLTAGIAVSGPGRTQGIPVIDLASLVEQLAQLIEWIEQIESMENQITNQINTIANQGTQIGELGTQISAMTGTRTEGSLLNSSSYQLARSYMPTNWQETLNLGSLSSGSGSSLSGEVNSIKANIEKFPRSDLGAPASSVSVSNLDAEQTAVASQQAMAGTTYDVTQRKIADLQTLVDQINATTDEKAAIDLNSRIAAEGVFLTNELLRTLAQAQLAASQQRALSAQESEMAIKQHYQPFDGGAAISGAASH